MFYKKFSVSFSIEERDIRVNGVRPLDFEIALYLNRSEFLMHELCFICTVYYDIKYLNIQINTYYFLNHKSHNTLAAASLLTLAAKSLDTTRFSRGRLMTCISLTTASGIQNSSPLSIVRGFCNAF